MATCRACGAAARVIACIEDRVIIKKILACLAAKAPTAVTALLPDSQAPPLASLFG